MALLGPTGVHEIEDITIAVAHVNPSAALRRRSDRVDHAAPNLRLALACPSLGATLAFGRRLAQERFLGGDAQHLAWLRQHGQHGLKQIAASAPVANRPQASSLPMVGVVDFGGILDQ